MTIELVATAELRYAANEKVGRSKKHEFIFSEYNYYGGKLGHVADEEMALFKRLFQLRNPSVYTTNTFELTTLEARSMLKTASTMLDRVYNRVPKGLAHHE